MTKTWENSANRFVLYTDILGFKDLIQREEHDVVLEKLTILSNFKNVINSMKWEEYINEDMLHDKPCFHSVTFSDSLFIFTKNDSIENFIAISFLSRHLMRHSIKNKIPIKGVLSHGFTTVNKKEHIFFGQPIVDAFLLENELNYIGIVIHNSFEKYFNDILPDYRKYGIKRNLKPILMELKTPLKKGRYKHFNVNWFKAFNEDDFDFNNKDFEDFLCSEIEEIKCNISGDIRRYIDNTIAVYDEIVQHYIDKNK